MAYAQTMSPQALHQQYRDVTAAPPSSQRLRQMSKQRFVAELSQCLFDFVIQLLPTPEEMAVKEDVRKLLERLIRTIEPDSRLLSFGSTANGFSLRNSDMDLCCLIDSEERLGASDLVTMLGDLLERETKFHVKPLPHARIPIVKLSLDPSPGLPLGIACDIGFENRLALENTRLLMCYAMIDPTRVRTLVLFLKVWSKRRKINSPYKGTLSSYGYVLLVIYFLVHVKNPPVLPNLQQMPPLRPISKEDTHVGGHNTWFFDDIDLLRQRWHSDNTETVAELLIDFFRYFSRDFVYNVAVASIRAGLLKKETKGWQNDLSASRYNDARERNRLCIEDPFEVDFNVARCVTKDGLYTIRGEFMRASRILSIRPDRAILALADLCEERKEEDLVTAPSFASPRQVPPQTPYSVGSRSMRPKAAPSIPERLSPSTKVLEPGPVLPQQVPLRPPPEHMAPKRSKWTSPPPPEAPDDDHTLFENQLGKGLELATASTEAREKEEAYNSSSSEILDDERSDAAESDDVTSIRSYTEGSTLSAGPTFRRPSWLSQASPTRIAPAQVDLNNEPPSRFISDARARFNRLNVSPEIPSTSRSTQPHPSKSDTLKISSSFPARPIKGRSPLAVSIPLPPSPDSPNPDFTEPATVFYQTGHTRSPRPTFLYPSPGHSPLSPYHTQRQYYVGPVPHDIFPATLPALSTMTSPHHGLFGFPVEASPAGRSSAGLNTPTPATYSSTITSSHTHTHSTSTLTAPTPPPPVPTPSQTNVVNSTPVIPPSSSLSRSPSSHSTSKSRPGSPLKSPAKDPTSESFLGGAMSPEASASTSNGSSPAPSSTGYATSLSRSPSPESLSPPPPPPAVSNKTLDHDVPGFVAQLKANDVDGVALVQSPLIEAGITSADDVVEAGDER